MPQLGILHLRTEGGDALPRAVACDRRRRPGRRPGDRSRARADRRAARKRSSRSRDFLELLINRVGKENFPAELVLDDASWVSYRLAEILPLPLAIKQSMLEINDSEVRLKVLAQFLQQQGLI